MQLNSILFPAPKCSYTPEKLQGELIWIPKYKKSHFPLARFSTLQSDSKTYFKAGTSCPKENMKNSVPHGHTKKSMPRNSSMAQSPIASFSTCTKQKLPRPEKLETQPSDCYNNNEFQYFNERCKQPSFTVPSNSNSPNVSISEESDLLEENPINTRKPSQMNFKQPNADKEEILDRKFSDEVSLSIEEFHIKFPESVQNKKRVVKNGSNFSSKDSNSKGSSVTQDNSINAEFIDHLQEKKSHVNIIQSAKFSGMAKGKHKKKPSIRIDPTKMTLTRDDSKLNFDPAVYEEFSIEPLSSPRNIPIYQTRTFCNPIVTSPKMTNLKSMNPGKPTKTNLFSASVAGNHGTGKVHVNFAKSVIGNSSQTPTPQNQNHHLVEQIEYHIPCMLLKASISTNKMLVYFHGNGEDIYLAYDLLSHIRNNLNIHVLAVEYPGYGLYKGAPCDNQILSDSETVFDYLTSKLNIHPKDLIIFGRSMGSGPASYLASRKNLGALVLMSAFTSIRAVVRDLAGKWAQYLIKERFNNLEFMSRVTCPSFLIHGLKDSLIPYKQSQELHNACKGPCELVLPKEMDHIEFDFYEDFTAPLAFFLTRCNFQLKPRKGAKIDFPASIFETPNMNKKLNNPLEKRYTLGPLKTVN